MSKFAIFISSQEKFSIKSENLPSLKNGEILVRNLCTSLCRSDIYTYQGKRIEKTPTILGHEIVGVISQMGPNSPSYDLRGKEFKVSDKITWAIYASSPDDILSKTGIPQKAKDLFKYGHEEITENNHFHGGLSEHTILRKNTPIIILNPAIPNEVASLINCSVATVAGAIRLAGQIKGKSILIYGAGMLGIIACAMVSTMGASEVITVDQNPERLAMSTYFGATKTMLSSEIFLSKVDVSLEFSGAVSAMENSIKVLKIGGASIWIGAVFKQPPISIDAEYLIRNILTIKGLHNYNNEDFVNAVNFIESNFDNFEFDKLIKKGFLLDDIDAAFDYAVNNNPFRVSIDLS